MSQKPWKPLSKLGEHVKRPFKLGLSLQIHKIAVGAAVAVWLLEYYWGVDVTSLTMSNKLWQNLKSSHQSNKENSDILRVRDSQQKGCPLHTPSNPPGNVITTTIARQAEKTGQLGKVKKTPGLDINVYNFWYRCKMCFKIQGFLQNPRFSNRPL